MRFIEKIVNWAKANRANAAMVAFACLGLLYSAWCWWADVPTKLQLDELKVQRSILRYNQRNAVHLVADREKLEKLQAIIDNHLMDPDAKTKNYHYIFGLEEPTGTKIENPREFDRPGHKSKKEELVGELKNYGIVSYRMGANGSFEELLTLVDKLNRGQYFARINEFKVMHGVGLNEDTLTMDFSISFLGKKNG